MATINRSTLSLSDITEIVEHIATDNPVAAGRVLDAIDATFRALADQPMIGRSREQLAPGLRSLPVRRYPAYLVFYRPLPAGIQVVRVLHGARDLPSQLRGL